MYLKYIFLAYVLHIRNIYFYIYAFYVYILYIKYIFLKIYIYNIFGNFSCVYWGNDIDEDEEQKGAQDGAFWYPRSHLGIWLGFVQKDMLLTVDEENLDPRKGLSTDRYNSVCTVSRRRWWRLWQSLIKWHIYMSTLQ